MKFKQYKDTNTLHEAFENIAEHSYAVLTVNDKASSIKLVKDLEGYKSFKINELQTYITKTEIQLKEAYIVINISDNDNITFQKEMMGLAEKYNQGNIRFYTNDSNYLISTSKNTQSYPGFGKIGVQVELNNKLFNESGEVIDLEVFEKSIEDGLGIIFPTEHEFKF